MDFLSFLANIIGSLSWPIMILIFILLLRKPLSDLIPLIRTLKYKEFEIEFGRKLEELEAQADRAALPSISPTPTVEGLKGLTPEAGYWEAIERLADVSPRAAIAEAWRRVEWALEDYFMKLGLERPPSYQGMVRAMRGLGEGSKLPLAAMNLFQELRVLRNKAVHARDFDFDSQKAIEFARLAERVISTLETKPV